MIVFIILVCILILFSIKADSVILYYLVFVILFCILGFRALTVGTDIDNYINIFYYYDGFIEIGWQAISGLVRYINGDFRTLMYFAAILTLLPLFYFVKKTSFLPIISLLFYVLLGSYFFAFNIMRQSIAISFFALAWYFFSENKKWKWVISCIIGLTFHYTMIILIPFFFLFKYFQRMKSSTRIILLIASLIIGPFLDVFIRQLITLIGGDYAAYSEYGSEYDINLLNSFMMQLIKSIFFIICYIRYVNKNNLYLVLFYIGLILSNLLSYTIGINRIGYYFMIFSIVFFANYIAEADSTSSKALNTATILIYGITLFAYLMLKQSEGTIPYNFM